MRAPWKFEGGAFKDADGSVLIGENDGRVNQLGVPIPGIVIRDIEVYRLVVAAPDLRALLSEVYDTMIAAPPEKLRARILDLLDTIAGGSDRAERFRTGDLT
jgi:hypothetical protein